MAGNGGNAARWEQLPVPLAEGVQLRGVQLPGFDGRPLPHPNPTVDDFAGWLAEDINKRDRPRVLFGTGIGGSIGLQAAQSANLADGYIFHSPVGPNLDTRLLPKLMKPRPLRSAVKKTIGGPAGRLLLRRRYRDRLSPEIIDDFAQGYLTCDAFEVLWDVLDAEWFTSLQPIAEPAILLWGGKDAVLGTDLAEGFKSVLPDAEVVVEPDWGHYPMLENPTEFAAAIASIARRLVS